MINLRKLKAIHPREENRLPAMNTDLPCIEAAVALPLYQTFTYRVPEPFRALAAIGKRVWVPFGRRTVTGYIIASATDSDRANVKSLLDVIDDIPLFPACLVPFFKWISRYYAFPLGQVICSALPGGINHHEVVTVHITEKGESALMQPGLSPSAARLLTRLTQGPCRLNTLRRQPELSVSAGMIHSLETRGWIGKTRDLEQGTPKPKTEYCLTVIRNDIPEDRFFSKRKQILDTIASEKEMPLKRVRELIPDASGYIRYLKDKGYVRGTDRRIYRDPLGDPIRPDKPPMLTEEQSSVIASVVNALDKGFSTFLLTGVTGSGKTEVYMQIADRVVKNGKSVLILVPEIALISQTERRFRARFGESIAVLHSGLTKAQRYDQWIRILRKEAVIVIGARSAIFAPLDHMGAVIVDEEHDTSYKQDGSFSYNARDLAVMRAKFQNCIALLGSATPSIQSTYNVLNGKFKGLELRHRVNRQPLPEICVVDLRKYRDQRGMNRYFTPELFEAVKQTMEQGNQALLFLNRRGYSSYPVCADCGEAVRCKNCDISMTLHQAVNAYKCHFCGYTRPGSAACSVCGSSKIYHLGLGTEKLEAAVKEWFPGKRTARMDRDTTSKKGALIGLLKGLRNREIDILIGTQMVVKGHDFPNITLVGIICADQSLNFPDFRAGERTFQLLAQVAGRAGRGQTPGKVILQTYNPENYSIECSKTQDVGAFYDKEIQFRKTLAYPPFSRMIQINISGSDKEKTRQHARRIGQLSRTKLQEIPGFREWVDVLGPVESPLTRIANRYRWQILFKSARPSVLHQFVYLLTGDAAFVASRQHVKTTVDVDPFFMM